MKKKDYLKTLVIGNKLIPVGFDDAGQTYYFEYLDSGNNLIEESCGNFNNNYLSYIEYRLGDPERDCPNYNCQMLSKNCKNRFSHGYCDKCKYQDVVEYKIQQIINLDITDVRGNLKPEFKNFIKIKTEKDIKNDD